jgi:hypothetical protein
MDASVNGSPKRVAAAAGAATGREATAPSTIRASVTAPSLPNCAAAATDSTGKSNAPRRRSFQYVLRHPVATGNWTVVRISVG